MGWSGHGEGVTWRRLGGSLRPGMERPGLAGRSRGCRCGAGWHAHERDQGWHGESFRHGQARDGEAWRGTSDGPGPELASARLVVLARRARSARGAGGSRPVVVGRPGAGRGPAWSCRSRWPDLARHTGQARVGRVVEGWTGAARRGQACRVGLARDVQVPGGSLGRRRDGLGRSLRLGKDRAVVEVRPGHAEAGAVV